MSPIIPLLVIALAIVALSMLFAIAEDVYDWHRNR